MATVADILGAINDLPALPGAVMQVTAMLSSSNPDTEKLEKVIKSDDALAIAVLREANSAIFGSPRQTFNLKESLVRLGSKNLMKIVLKQSAIDIFASSGKAYGMRRGDMWRGAMGGAVAAELLAKKSGFKEVELCYLCGLLRDIGKLAIETYFGSKYIIEMEECNDPEKSFVECEREAFGADHATIGAELALHWSLPERIAMAIRYHHEPPSDGPEHDELFDIVHAADIICLWTGFAVGHDGLRYELAPHVRDSLNLNRKEAEVDIAVTWDRVNELEKIMNHPLTKEKSA